MQRCQHCKIEKPLSDFHKNRNRKNGHCPECKVCANKRSAKRYAKEGTKLRKQMAEQRKREYEHRINIERKSRNRHKEKYRYSRNARQSVRNKVLNANEFLLLDKDLKRIYNSRCWNCQTNDNISLDHIIPISKGGKHSVGNMLSLCSSCNSSKGNKLLSEWRYKRR